ncbi:MAG: hypothetical protein QW838_02820 [Candidatus Nitrosotenuis sp.]
MNERAIRDYENVLGVRVETKQALREHVSRHRLMENERIRYESNRERVERQLSRSAVERVRIDAIRKVMQE